MRQTYKEFEIILIDDGSTDNSFEIENRLVELDERISLYRYKNSGVSTARNRGIKKATGDYITFIDVDDEMELNALETIMKYIFTENPDVIIYGWKRCGKDENEEIHVSDKMRFFEESDTVLKKILGNYSDYGGGYPWNKVWKRNTPDYLELFNPELSYFEDLEWVVRMLNKAKTVLLLPDCLYRYNVNPNGVTLRVDRRERNELEYHKSIQYIIQDLNDRPDLYDWFVEKYIPEIPNGIVHARRMKWRSVEEFLSGKLEKYKTIFDKSSNIPVRTKIRVWILSFQERRRK